MADEKVVIGGGACGCCIIILIILAIVLPISYTICEVDEICLGYNKWTQNIYYDSGMSKPGRHYTGILGTLITFQRTNILIDFSNDSKTPNSTESTDVTAYGGNTLACWTKDGTNVYIDISFYIRLKEQQVLRFYKEYGDKWIDFIVRNAYVDVKEITIKYQTEEFFTKRNDIGNAIIEKLKEDFRVNFNNAISLEDLQLRKIQFDEGFEEATVNKLIQLHRKKSFENQKQIKTVNKETERDVAKIQNDIDLILAQGTAQGEKSRSANIGEAYKSLTIAFCDAYGKMKADLSLSNADLKKYMLSTELDVLPSYGRFSLIDPNTQKTFAG